MTEIILEIQQQEIILEFNSAPPVSGASTADVVDFTPAGNIVATNVQAAIEELDSEKAALAHNHTISQITNLQSEIDNKSNVGHAHVIGDVTGLQTGLDGKAPMSHAHAISDVTNLQSSLNSKSDSGHNHVINDVQNLQATLDVKADLVGGVLPTSQLPAQAVSDFLGDVASQSAMLALTGQRGDWCIRTDVNRTYFLIADNASVLANWRYIETPASPVVSVNGQTGVIVLNKTDIGLSNVPNLDTSDPANISQSSSYRFVTDAQTLVWDAIAFIDASQIPVTPAGQITAINVQAALEELDGLKADWGHSHIVSDIDGLEDALLSKSDVTHTHDIGDVTGLGAELANKTDVGHEHAIGDVTGLQGSLDALSTAVIDTLPTLIGTKQDSLPNGDATKYLRGDLTMQTLDKTAVGLINVDNTSDTNKPVSTAQQTALDLKANISGNQVKRICDTLITIAQDCCMVIASSYTIPDNCELIISTNAEMLIL